MEERAVAAEERAARRGAGSSPDDAVSVAADKLKHAQLLHDTVTRTAEGEQLHTGTAE